MSHRHLLKLHTDLISYGLNPAEWSIQQIQATYYRVQHLTDDNFTFLGVFEFKNRRPRWKSLELVSY